MDELEYREFLKKSSRALKVGVYRIILSLIVSVGVLVLAIIRMDVALFIIAGLFALVAWLNVDLRMNSQKTFQAIEFVARSKEGLPSQK